MKKSWRNNVEFYLIGLLLLMVIAFSIAMPNIFWSVSNFQSIASQMPVLGIPALAMAMTMLCGGINLSIIATANACSLVMAWWRRAICLALPRWRRCWPAEGRR